MYVVISAKLVPVGYGIKKLQISCVVEDDKVSTDDLEDAISAFEDYVSDCFVPFLIYSFSPKFQLLWVNTHHNHRRCV